MKLIAVSKPIVISLHEIWVSVENFTPFKIILGEDIYSISSVEKGEEIYSCPPGKHDCFMHGTHNEKPIKFIGICGKEDVLLKFTIIDAKNGVRIE
jgi:hypothetical protein